MSARLPKILLLDSNALIHRSYHALPPLTTPKGEQVNAVYGFANALLKAIKDEKPDYVVACFDKDRETFRNEIFDGYKAHRKETDNELVMQIPRVRQIVEVLNIPLYEQKGVEADDLIGSLSKIAAKQGLQTVIVTGDNDALQLVNDSVSVYSLRRGVTDTLTYHRNDVKEKIGVFPEQIVDYKSLAGDSSDNIPGAPGIGPKTAVELLEKYKTLEGVYEHLDELKERPATILRENKKTVDMSRRLAQIREDLEIELDLKEASVVNFDFSKVVGLFQELDFRSLLTKLPQAAVPSQASLFGVKTEATKIEPTLPFEAITTLKRWEELAKKLASQPILCIDTETVDLDGELIGISFAWSKDNAAYLPLKPHPEGFELKDVEASVYNILYTVPAKKIGHNLKYDLHALAAAGLEVSNVWFDTMIASQLVNTSTYSHRLDDLAMSELNFKKIPTTQLLGDKKDGKIVGLKASDSSPQGLVMTNAPLEDLAAYACEDVLVTWRLFEKMRPELEAAHLKRVFYEIEMPLLPILVEMERAGIKVDRKYLEKLGQNLKARLKKIEAEAAEKLGGGVNIASPSQLQEVLYKKLNLSVVGVKKIKSGYSTDADSLMKLRDKHPAIKLILEYREVAKLLNTYIETLPTQIDKNGRIHTSFGQIGAATGRMSSNNPNLQNIPIRTDLGNEVRRAFVADEGKVFLGADYSQAELRVLAHLCGDKGLIEAFHSGQDFHAQVGEKLMVDRRSAKAINFGIIYGLGSSALANDLGIPVTEAKEFIEKYFATFPGVRQFIESCKQKARQEGFAETLFGRRRYLPDIHSPNMMLRSAAERIAVNMPCQGCLPASTKVLTTSGYCPIGKLKKMGSKKPDKVWDGSNWQGYEVVDRGSAELAEIHFANGQILRCDTRHKVLALNEESYYWANFTDLKLGDKVCFSLPFAAESRKSGSKSFEYSKKVHNSNDFSIQRFPSKFWYWLGYYYGDGHLTARAEQHRYSLQYAFGGTETNKRLACQNFFSELGFRPRVREFRQEVGGQVRTKESVEIYSRPCVELLESVGTTANATAHTKRLPQTLFEQPLESRKEFIKGLMDSDGYLGSHKRYVPTLHLCQKELLEDVQLLLRSMGVESRIGKGVKGGVSYKLFIKRRDLAVVMPEKLVKAKFTRENLHSAPRFILDLIRHKYPELPKRHFINVSDYVVYRRILRGGKTSIYHLVEWLGRNNLTLPTPLYTWHEVLETRELGVYDTTYTLAVASESHRFDSEGVISKNTVADLMKYSMVQVSDKLPDGAKMLLQIHDELLFEVEKGSEERLAKVVKEVMGSVAELKVPMVVDIKVGPNWADLEPLRR